MAANLHHLLHSRALRLAVLLFQALWLNVIVPGHTRGSVQLPGPGCPACAAEWGRLACCATEPGKPGDPARAPAGDPAAHCAICQFAAVLSIPPALDLTLPSLGLLELRQARAVERPVAVSVLLPYQGRAPPPVV